MIAWWTNLDIEIVCSHKDDTHYNIQNGDGNAHIAKCSVCGQEYFMELIVYPIDEIEIPAERLEILNYD
jgi:hypothetical protein